MSVILLVESDSARHVDIRLLGETASLRPRPQPIQTGRLFA